MSIDRRQQSAAERQARERLAQLAQEAKRTLQEADALLAAMVGSKR